VIKGCPNLPQQCQQAIHGLHLVDSELEVQIAPHESGEVSNPALPLVALKEVQYAGSQGIF